MVGFTRLCSLVFVLALALVLAAPAVGQFVVKTASSEQESKDFDAGLKVLEAGLKPGKLPDLKIPQRPSAGEILGKGRAKAAASKVKAVVPAVQRRSVGLVRRLFGR